MPEISHVRMIVPEQSTLNRVLREGGAQQFPQWLYAEPGTEARIVSWGLRGVPIQMLDIPPADDARRGLFPLASDDWTEAPRGVVIATVDIDRAITDLEPALGSTWHDVAPDETIGADCRRLVLGRSVLVLAQPNREGFVSAALARFGEGPVAVALDGTTAGGRPARANPVSDGPATYVRIGPRPAPYLIFLPAR
jgi:hypothetical protein